MHAYTKEFPTLSGNKVSISYSSVATLPLLFPPHLQRLVIVVWFFGMPRIGISLPPVVLRRYP